MRNERARPGSWNCLLRATDPIRCESLCRFAIKTCEADASCLTQNLALGPVQPKRVEPVTVVQAQQLLQWLFQINEARRSSGADQPTGERFIRLADRSLQRQFLFELIKFRVLA